MTHEVYHTWSADKNYQYVPKYSSRDRASVVTQLYTVCVCLFY